MLAYKIAHDMLVHTDLISSSQFVTYIPNYGVWNGSYFEINLSGDSLQEVIIDITGKDLTEDEFAEKVNPLLSYETCYNKPYDSLIFYPANKTNYTLKVKFSEIKIFFPKIINCNKSNFSISYMIRNPGGKIDSRTKDLHYFYLKVSYIHIIVCIFLLFGEYRFPAFGAYMKSISTLLFCLFLLKSNVYGKYCFYFEMINYLSSDLLLFSILSYGLHQYPKKVQKFAFINILFCVITHFSSYFNFNELDIFWACCCLMLNCFTILYIDFIAQSYYDCSTFIYSFIHLVETFSVLITRYTGLCHTYETCVITYYFVFGIHVISLYCYIENKFLKIRPEI